MHPATRTALIGRVITAPGASVVADGAVVIEGGTIRAVGRAGELEPLTRDAHRIEVAGTILPGLINAHVHLAFDVTADPFGPLERGDVDVLRTIVAANARALLDGGVTTARDLGDRDGLVAAFRDRVTVGEVPGPRMLTAGAPLTSPRGHCWYLGGEVDPDPVAVRRAVADRVAAGADVVKVMASGGVLTPSGIAMWEPQFGGDVLAAVVDAAHDAGLPVAAHAHGTGAMDRCARAGVDTIEHGSWRTAPAPGQERAYDLRDDVAERIVAAGSVLVPTRARGWETWPDGAGREAVLASLAFDARHGITVIAGNDAGVGPGYFDDLVDTLTLHAAAGLSNAGALALATTGAATALGLGDRTGRLAPGYAADVLVVDGDPLADLHALRDVRLVVAAGRVHERTAYPWTP